jgi:hypothetical protein
VRKNLYIYSQLIFHYCTKNLQGEKGQSFQQMGLGKLNSYTQKNEIGTLSHTNAKSNSKWIKNLYRKSETIKLLEENRKVSQHRFVQ